MKTTIRKILTFVVFLVLIFSCTERIFLETVNGFVKSEDNSSYFLKFGDYPDVEYVFLNNIDNDSLEYCISSCEETEIINEKFVLNYLVADGEYNIFFLDDSRDTIFQTIQYLENLPLASTRNDLLEIVILDVKQGDSFIIITPDEKDITIIDGGYGSIGTFGGWAGSGETILLNYMIDRQLNNIYTLVETHNDADHYGGLYDVVNSTEIDFERYIDANSNDSIFVGDTLYFFSDNNSNNSVTDKSINGQIFNINYPPDFADSSSENNRSIFFKLNYNNFDMLFTGDIEHDIEEYILANYVGDLEADLDSEILKVAHHGSRYSTTDDFLELANSNISIISAGEGNPYHHPTDEVIDKLNFSNNKIFRTDMDGTIRIFTDGKSIEIVTGG